MLKPKGLLGPDANHESRYGMRRYNNTMSKNAYDETNLHDRKTLARVIKYVFAI
jgi:hypothetical protein